MLTPTILPETPATAPPTFAPQGASPLLHDLHSACSLLLVWLQAAADGVLDANVAHIALHTVGEMLEGWQDSDLNDGGKDGITADCLLYGQNLVTLTERALWSRCQDGAGEVNAEEVLVVKHALTRLIRAAEAHGIRVAAAPARARGD